MSLPRGITIDELNILWDILTDMSESALDKLEIEFNDAERSVRVSLWDVDDQLYRELRAAVTVDGGK